MTARSPPPSRCFSPASDLPVTGEADRTTQLALFCEEAVATTSHSMTTS
jgi:hypothetical protein